MKKIYVITTLALALIFVFTACQKPDDESSAQNESTVSQESQITESQPEVSEPVPQVIKIFPPVSDEIDPVKFNYEYLGISCGLSVDLSEIMKAVKNSDDRSALCIVEALELTDNGGESVSDYSINIKLKVVKTLAASETWDVEDNTEISAFQKFVSVKQNENQTRVKHVAESDPPIILCGSYYCVKLVRFDSDTDIDFRAYNYTIPINEKTVNDTVYRDTLYNTIRLPQHIAFNDTVIDTYFEKTEGYVPEVSEPEPETSEPEEGLPEIFTNKPVTPDTILVPEGYQEILSLIENREYKKAYLLVKEKSNDMYATQLLANFKEFHVEYSNLYNWYGYVDTEEYIYTINEMGLPTQRLSSMGTDNDVWRYDFDEKGLMHTDHNGHTKYYYDEQDRLTEIKTERESNLGIYRQTLKLYWNNNGLLDKVETITNSYSSSERIENDEYYYDQYGRIIRWDYYDNGKQMRVVTWEHDENGKTKQKTSTSRSGYVETTTYSYNEKGQNVKIETTDTSGKLVVEEFTYDSFGNVLLKTKVVGETEISRYEYTYDERGYIKTETWNSTEHLSYDYGTTEYTTDENGNVIKIVSIGENAHNGEVDSVTEIGYNEDGEMVWRKYIRGPEVWSSITYKGYSAFYHKYQYFYIIP